MHGKIHTARFDTIEKISQTCVIIRISDDV